MSHGPTRGNAFAEIARRALADRRLPVGVGLLAVALCLPSLGVGWIADDQLHRLAFHGSRYGGEAVLSPLDLFRFLDGDPQKTIRLMDFGVLPWWTYPGVKGAFWRPLASLTHWLDYRLWPTLPGLMHAQSLLWFGLLAVAVAVLYRRFMGATWIAGLAAVFYAIDDAHGVPVAFLANRNAILATLLGVLALLAHDRRRGDGRRGGAILGPLLLAASLLSAEEGIATCAYLISYAFWLDRGSWRERCLALLPYAGVVLAWRIAWSGLGYGLADVGLYVDPLRDPGRFLTAVAQRGPVYLLAQWALPPADVLLILNRANRLLLEIVALAFLALLAVAFFPLLRRDRIARFWTCGMILAVPPICAAFPGDRLLFFVGIGAMGLLAQWLAMVFGEPGRKPTGKIRRGAAVTLGCALVFIHGILAPLALPFRAGYPVGPKGFIEKLLFLTPMDGSLARQDLVIVNLPIALLAGYTMVVRELEGLPVPRHTRVLAHGFAPTSIHRRDERTLVVRPRDGYLAWTAERLVRDERHPMALGERVALTGLSVEITALTADGRPAEATFRFDVPLEDPSLRWLQWTDGAFEPFTPPAIGETVEVRPFVKRMDKWGIADFFRF
jgi:hypothetical protein